MTRSSITTGSSTTGTRRAAQTYGVRTHEEQAPAVYQTSGATEVLEYTFSYDSLPTYGGDQLIQRIPANARIISATPRVITAFAGGTSYDVGLYDEDGNAIDADGIDDDILLAAINAVGETVVCDGALVGNTAGIGTTAGQVVVAATGTFTAGKATLVIEYERLYDRAALNE